MKRYKIESGGTVWRISSDRNLSRDEIAKVFVADLKQGRAPDVLGLIARIRGPALRGYLFIVLPYFLRKHGLIDERECRRLKKKIAAATQQKPRRRKIQPRRQCYEI